MKYFFFLSTLFCATQAFAQPYWQQKAETKIDVRLDDNKHLLYAYETLTYTNNSPDTLKFIYIHLWPNAYKHDHTPFAKQLELNGNSTFYFSKPTDRGFIDSLQFMVDGKFAEHFITEDVPDIARLDLPQPLYPNHSIVITTPFKVKIPKVFSRFGHTGQAYYVSQWFPKPAVYDRKGWHPISYLDQGEFFSEYGTYDVNITLPQNYIVMATGNCMDEKENNWLDKIAKDTLPSDTLYTKWFPPSSKELKTVHFHEDNVHDFAWFADKRWSVTKDTVYSPGNNQLVTTWSAFLPAYKKSWAKSNTYLKETIKHYGKYVGTYPYKTIKAVLGDMHAGGGMEYPTVTIIDKGASTSLKTVIIHEAGHNWFYGLLGSMERDHAWMDEGINTFYENKTSKDITDKINDTLKTKKKKKSKTFASLNEELAYYEFAATHNDMAIDQPSTNFTNITYGLDVYYKTNLMLKWLEKYMGKDDFENGMHNYFKTWEYKHPYPEDFKKCMQQYTAKSIDWFFDPGLISSKPIDFKITKAKITGNNTEITIKNKTRFNSPVLIDAYSKDSLIATAWTAPFDNTTSLSIPTTSWTTLKIDNDIPDYKHANNLYRRHALLHNFGLTLKPIIGIKQSENEKLFISPSLGYNNYDGVMAGILLHNFTLPENNFRFFIIPMYAFNSNSLVGAGSVGYQWYADNLFKDILLQADVKSFHDDVANPKIANISYLSFLKIAPALNFTFNEHNAQSTVTRTLTLKGYSITEQNSVPSTDSSSWTAKTQQKLYGLINYSHVNKRTFNPFSYNFEGQIGADFAKIGIEGNLRIDYNVRSKSMYIRAFVGQFFAINNNPAISSRYELNSSFSGVNDYLFDGTYFGRNSSQGFTSQQISMQEGGFKIPVFNHVGRSDSWLAAINLRTDLPKTKLPIYLFFDAGLIPNSSPSFNNSGGTTLMYDGGIEIEVYSNFMSIYIPLIMCPDFNNYISSVSGNSNYFNTLFHSITFTMQFQNINWLKSPLKYFKLG